jgi:hypothetical protein
LPLFSYPFGSRTLLELGSPIQISPMKCILIC